MVFQSDFIAELIAQLPGRGGRVRQEGLGRAVHEGDGQHQRLLGLGRLQLQPGRRLVTGSIVKGSLEPLLAVGGVAGRAVTDEGPEVLDELVGGREAPHTQREQDPTSGVRALGGIVCQLFADLTVDLITELGPEDAVTDDEVELLQVGGGPGLQPGVVGVGSVLFFLEFPLDLVSHLVLSLKGERDELVSDGPLLFFDDGLSLAVHVAILVTVAVLHSHAHQLSFLEFLGADKVSAESGSDLGHDRGVV